MNIIIRQGNITFSREFVDVNREYNIKLTRRNRFRKNGICINHGNSKPITILPLVSEFYLINKPDAIKYCSNKIKNYRILKKFYPTSYQSIHDVNKFPVIVKPYNGHHGYGIKIFNSKSDFIRFMDSTNNEYIIQDCIPIKHEFRFNVFDREIFQISHKERLHGSTDGGGFIFSYRSLGQNAKISDKFRDFVSNTITTFHRSIGYDLGDYCIDVMKSIDGEYYLSELNSAYGIGSLTLEKLIDVIQKKYESNKLRYYRVR